MVPWQPNQAPRVFEDRLWGICHLRVVPRQDLTTESQIGISSSIERYSRIPTNLVVVKSGALVNGSLESCIPKASEATQSVRFWSCTTSFIHKKIVIFLGECIVRSCFRASAKVRTWPSRIWPTGMTAPDCMNAEWNKSSLFWPLSGPIICSATEMEPADCPQLW